MPDSTERAGLRAEIAKTLCRRSWAKPSAYADKPEWQRLGFKSLEAAVEWDFWRWEEAAGAIIAGPLSGLLRAAQAVIDYDGDQIKPPYIDLLLILEAEVSRARGTTRGEP